jgi:hypothetical protein
VRAAAAGGRPAPARSSNEHQQQQDSAEYSRNRSFAAIVGLLVDQVIVASDCAGSWPPAPSWPRASVVALLRVDRLDDLGWCRIARFSQAVVKIEVPMRRR